MLYEINYTTSAFPNDDRSKVVEAPAHRKGRLPQALIDHAESIAYEHLVQWSYGQQDSTDIATVRIGIYSPCRIGYGEGNTSAHLTTMFESRVTCIRKDGVAHRFTSTIYSV